MNMDKFFNTHGGVRGEWEFEYTAAKVADGAEAQKAFRESRVTWWRDQYAKTMAKIRESGVKVDESLAAQLSAVANTTAYRGPSVTIDATLQEDLTEAHQKIEFHSGLVAEYDGWSQVLRANPEQRVKLTQADWLYFFGKV